MERGPPNCFNSSLHARGRETVERLRPTIESPHPMKLGVNEKPPPMPATRLHLSDVAALCFT